MAAPALIPDRRGLAAGFGVWLAVAVAFALELEEPLWAAMSAYRISDPDDRVLFSRGVMRVVGTVIGCVFGYVLAVQLQDILVAQVFVLFVVISFCTYERFVSAYSYAWVLAGVTFTLIMVTSFESPDNLLAIAYFRGSEILVGVIVMMIVDALVMRPKRHFGHYPKPPKPDGEALDSITKAALLSATAAIVIPVLWFWLLLPSLVQVVVTTIAVLEKDFASTRWKSLMRVSGCLIGGGAGVIVAGLGIQSFWLWSVFLLLGMVLFAQIHHGKTRFSYLGTQAGYGFLFGMIIGPGPPGSIMPAVDRLVGISLGIVVMIVLYMMIESLFPSARERAARRR